MGAARSCIGRGLPRKAESRAESESEDAARDELEEATRVRLVGLQRRADLNGEMGFVKEAMEGDSGIKCRVEIKGGTSVWVKLQNIEFVQHLERGFPVKMRAVSNYTFLVNGSQSRPIGLEGVTGFVAEDPRDDGRVVVLLDCMESKRKLLVRARRDQVLLRGGMPCGPLQDDAITEIDVSIPTAKVLSESGSDDTVTGEMHPFAGTALWQPGEFSVLEGLKSLELNGRRCVVVGSAPAKASRIVVQVCESKASTKTLRELSVDPARLSRTDLAAPLLWGAGAMAVLYGLRNLEVLHLNGLRCFVLGRAPTAALLRFTVSVRDPKKNNRERILSVRADRLIWPFVDSMPPVASTVSPIAVDSPSWASVT
ncbi:Hypothetical Protein FCC1311_016722 [Hondaea fermentalgiana]|uniref:Uncharacterized protein n=1 Tax=Hondaea fermentalgiana TaxID=2315210 RepID=A0A2R5GCH1_9STRA|nr:Hypothetical Protein FCC1311_016722 [Hondaea fermentalgiana]|eukprot:GBG25454.1 Hypothetical Protein FCC1311_016722 [Hondaea fermentalgiana]